MYNYYIQICFKTQNLKIFLKYNIIYTAVDFYYLLLIS